MRARLLVTLSAIVLAATSGVLGQPGALEPQQAKPMFRSGQNLILVDVTVKDKQGKPIEGLTAADFEVLENGKTQEIDTFTFEKIGRAHV